MFLFQYLAVKESSVPHFIVAIHQTPVIGGWGREVGLFKSEVEKGVILVNTYFVELRFDSGSHSHLFIDSFEDILQSLNTLYRYRT